MNPRVIDGLIVVGVAVLIALFLFSGLSHGLETKTVFINDTLITSITVDATQNETYKVACDGFLFILDKGMVTTYVNATTEAMSIDGHAYIIKLDD